MEMGEEMDEGRLVYLHGFASGPGSAKATELAGRFAAMGRKLEVPDLSAGDFRRTTLTRQLALVGELLGGEPAMLLGSSLGGYLAALYAARHEEVERVVLIAPAFRFHRRWIELLGEGEIERWRRKGARRFFHYSTGREELLDYGFLRDAARYEEFPVVKQPCLVIHGERDEVVPVALSRQYAAQAGGRRLRVVDSDHGLLDSVDVIWTEIRNFAAPRA